MLHPKEMSRVLIVGPKDKLEETIEILHSMKILHILDFRAEDRDFKLGKPLSKASEISENLVKLRSISSILEVGKVEKLEKVEIGKDVRQKILTLELNISEEDSTKKKVESLLSDISRKIEEIKPFSKLPLKLEMYRDYSSLEVFVGSISKDLEGLENITKEYELFQEERVIALFVIKEKSEEVREFLSRKGFSPLEIPKGEDDPKILLKDLESQREKWQKRLEEIQDRLVKLRERYAHFVISAEDYLAGEIEKAEAPLRFAATEHSFVIDGWVPDEKFEEMKIRLEKLGDLYVSKVEKEGEEAPVLLNNPKPSRPFEFLIHLFSTPRYEELDPTAVVSVVFPLFFGLMIGDFGYGVVMVLFALLVRNKLKAIPELRDLAWVMMLGGVFALFFGFFMYGEAFGVPFHAPSEHPEQVNWSAIIGFDIPFVAIIHKLEVKGVIDLLVLSITASFIHLGIGFAFGVANERKHSMKHAMAKVGWLIVLFALFVQLMTMARGHSKIADSVWSSVLSYVPQTAYSILGMNFSIVFIAALLIGIFAILVPCEGLITLVEWISLLANMMSYTRLAGVAVAKGATAIAFNFMLLPLVMSGNIAFIIVGFILLFLAHAMVFFLGAISSGIQALRLNYVEFFLKFFKGSGLKFQPFGLGKRSIQEV